MTTPFSSVYEVFLSQISDINYVQMDQSALEADLLLLMKSAINNFEFPREDLHDRNDEEKVFNETLNEDTVQVLGVLMVHEWLKRSINRIQLIKQSISDKDLKLTSQAEHLNTLIKLKADNERELEKLKTRYSYRINRTPNYSGLAGDVTSPRSRR